MVRANSWSNLLIVGPTSLEVRTNRWSNSREVRVRVSRPGVGSHLQARGLPSNIAAHCVGHAARCTPSMFHLVSACATSMGDGLRNVLERGSSMTMPDERTRALLWAGGFFIDIAQDESLPLALRRRAVTISRHFPTIEDVAWIVESLRDSVLSIGLASPENALPEEGDWCFTVLRHSTRLGWPGEG